MLSDQARTQNAQVAAQTSVARMQEKLQRDSLIGDMLAGQAALNTQQYNTTLGGAQTALAGANEALQAFGAKGALAQRNLAAQGLGSQTSLGLGGQIGSGIGTGFGAGQGALGASQNIYNTNNQLNLAYEQLDAQKQAAILGLVGAGIGAVGTFAAGGK